MNQLTSVIYLSFVFCILLFIALLLTKQIFNFYYWQYILRKSKNTSTYNYTEKQHYQLSQAYKNKKLWALLLNNVENALKEKKIKSTKFNINSFKIIHFVYTVKNFTFLSSKYNY
jgi:Tfp pilus assembly protein PilO